MHSPEMPSHHQFAFRYNLNANLHHAQGDVEFSEIVLGQPSFARFRRRNCAVVVQMTFWISTVDRELTIL